MRQDVSAREPSSAVCVYVCALMCVSGGVDRTGVCSCVRTYMCVCEWRSIMRYIDLIGMHSTTSPAP